MISFFISFVSSAQVSRQYGDFTAVTFERKHYPSPYKKQSDVTKKAPTGDYVYNEKYDIYIAKKEKVKAKRGEAQVSDKNSSPKKVDHEEFDMLPFEGSGRLEAENSLYNGVGSATLFDKDVIITAGHNFLSTIDGETQRFDKATYRHKSLHKKDCKSVRVEKIHLHPKWESAEDSDYDVAVCFLAKKLPLKKKLSLLEKGLGEGTGVLVTGYPLSTMDMHQSTGEVVKGRKKDRLYHNANTRVGNSGGSIVLDDSRASATTRGRNIIAGIHTRAEDNKKNSGVLLRKEIIDFILETVRAREEGIKRKKQEQKKQNSKPRKK